MSIFSWLKRRLSGSEDFKGLGREAETVEVDAEFLEEDSKGFREKGHKQEIQDPSKMVSVIQNMTVLLHRKDDDLRALRSDLAELNKEIRELLKELTALKTSQASTESYRQKNVGSSNPAIARLLKALKEKPLSYEEIRIALGIQSKAGAYSYVSMAISQGHPIDKIKEGRSRRVLRTDVEYKSEDTELGTTK